MELGMENARVSVAPGPRTAPPPALHQRPDRGGRSGTTLAATCSEELRIPVEEGGSGMVLVGNSRVYTQLTGGHRSGGFRSPLPRVAKNAPTKARRLT